MPTLPSRSPELPARAADTPSKPVGTVVFGRAERGKDPSQIVADQKFFDEPTRAGVRLQAALCALELLMP